MADLPPLPLELREDHVPVTCHAARDAEIRAAIRRTQGWVISRVEEGRRAPEPIIGFHADEVVFILDEVGTDFRINVLGEFPQEHME